MKKIAVIILCGLALNIQLRSEEVPNFARQMDGIMESLAKINENIPKREKLLDLYSEEQVARIFDDTEDGKNAEEAFLTMCNQARMRIIGIKSIVSCLNLLQLVSKESRPLTKLERTVITNSIAQINDIKKILGHTSKFELGMNFDQSLIIKEDHESVNIAVNNNRTIIRYWEALSESSMELLSKYSE